MREALAYEFFRDAGVPAPRTAFALVYVTVEGKHDRELAGLYTLVEEVNKPFLRAHFGNAKGLLLKPEGAFDLPDLGDAFDKYEKMYRPKTDGTSKAKQRLIDLVKLIHHADDATFAKQLPTLLDVDAYVRFLAANAMIGNMDSMLSTGHNFYCYVHPETGRACFVPWDLNLSFGGFDWVGTLVEQSTLSIAQPYVKKNTLAERVLNVEAFDKLYRAEAKRINETVLTPDRFGKKVEAVAALIAQAEKRANVPHRALPKNAPPEMNPAVWAKARHANLNAQLAGETDGFAPYWQKGLFGRTPPPATKPAKRPATAPAPTVKKP
jgi:spore coat protein CotH